MDKQIEELTKDIIKSLSTEYIYAQSEVMSKIEDQIDEIEKEILEE